MSCRFNQSGINPHDTYLTWILETEPLRYFPGSDGLTISFYEQVVGCIGKIIEYQNVQNIQHGFVTAPDSWPVAFLIS
jgi:hypothetical protein